MPASASSSANPSLVRLFGSTNGTPSAAAVLECLAAGADPDERDADGDTPLLFAARNGWADAVLALAPVSDPCAFGTHDKLTPLMAAVAVRASVPTLEALLPGSDLHALDSDEWTPLHWTAALCYPEAMALVLPASSPDARDDEGLTALHFCHSDPDPDPAVQAASRASAEACYRLLLAAGADPAAVSDKGSTPFQRAVAGGCPVGVEILSALCPDELVPPPSACPPIIRAARGGSPDVVRVLAAAGVDLDPPPFDGLGALASAARFEASDEFVRILAEAQGPGAPRRLAVAGEQLRAQDDVFCATRLERLLGPAAEAEAILASIPPAPRRTGPRV